MDRNPDIHFHICWSHERIDWECFTSHTNAEERAQELVQPNETYSIESFNGHSCEQCRGFRGRIAKSFVPKNFTKRSRTA
jgi:hypothetical protein